LTASPPTGKGRRDSNETSRVMSANAEPATEAANRAAEPLLLTPITLRGVTARNRIVVSPMCQYVSVDGGPTDWQFVHFGRYAMGGAGIVFGEETAVEARGRKTYHCAGLWNDHQAKAYRRVTDFIKQMGALPAIQLGHCGRNAGSHGAMEDWRALDERDARAGMPPWRGLAPSPLPARRGFPVPIEMDHDDIRTVLAAFRDAAHRATDAGYDICEIHGAHGYLIHQFLSPVSNRRTDGYGGSREGRMRFALDVAETVRVAWPQDRPLFFRVSAVDGKGGLWGLDDTVALARELRQREVDVVDCSSGGIAGDSEMAQVPRVPGYQVPYASRVRRETGVMTMAVGLITDPHQAEAVLAEGHADLVAMARELMIHADWPLRAAKALNAGEYDLMAPSIAHRLRRRDEQAVAYPPGCAVEIPIMADRREPYRWQ
jgi:2,4-dienoyl-CoA reductase-like NADH-dependent reductase (Old Yellow Enzyme family)